MAGWEEAGREGGREGGGRAAPSLPPPPWRGAAAGGAAHAQAAGTRLPGHPPAAASAASGGARAGTRGSSRWPGGGVAPRGPRAGRGETEQRGQEAIGGRRKGEEGRGRSGSASRCGAGVPDLRACVSHRGHSGRRERVWAAGTCGGACSGPGL